MFLSFTNSHRKGCRRLNRTMNKRNLQYQATLERINNAVDQLVQEVGFDQMRIRDICSLAGISTGAFYHYFASKNELLFARYSRANQIILENYEQNLQSMNAVDALLAQVDFQIDYLRTRIPDVLRQYQKTRIDFQSKWELQEPDEMHDVYYRIVRKGLDEGTIRTHYSAEQIAEFIFFELL